MSRREAIGGHKLDGFSRVCEPTSVRNLVDSCKHGLLRRVRVQIKFGFMACLESIHANLDSVGADVEVIGDIPDKAEHFLEICGAHRTGRIQQEDYVRLSEACWKYRIYRFYLTICSDEKIKLILTKSQYQKNRV